MNSSPQEVGRRHEPADHRELPKCVRKRDGSLVAFDQEKVFSALARAGAATGEFSESKAQELSSQFLDYVAPIRDSPWAE